MTILDCDCNIEGSANGKLCGPSSGQCTCKPGFSGRRCQGKLKHNAKINYKA